MPKRKLTIEFERVRITGDLRGGDVLWCPSCNGKSEFIGHREALDLARIGGYDRCDRSRLHFHTPSEDETKICVTSLLAALESSR